MSHRIVALSYLALTEDIMKTLSEISDVPINFPAERASYSSEEMVAKTGNASMVLVGPGVTIDKSYLSAVPHVKYIGLCGSSASNIDIDYVKARGITLTTVMHYGDEPTAEFIIAQITNLLRGIGDYQWREKPHELMGKSLGIIGLGSLGQAVAHLALAYKMSIRYCGPHRKQEWDTRGLQYEEKGRLLSQSDIVILSAPGNTEVLTYDDFGVMQAGAILVQASQGTVFDRDGFMQWIKRDGNYAMFDMAAGVKNYELYSDLPRVIFPKIVAGHSIETKERLGEAVVSNVRKYINDQADATK